MIEIKQIFEIDSCENSALKVVGFYCMGHMNHSDFLESKQFWEYIAEHNEEKDLDEQEQLNLHNLPRLKHIYWIVEKAYPEEPDCDCEVFVRCSHTRQGAISVTVLDI